MIPRYHTSRPCRWVLPRQAMHPSERAMRFGRIEPMPIERGIIARLLGLAA